MADMNERDFLKEASGTNELHDSERLIAQRKAYWMSYFVQLWYGAYRFEGLPDTIRSRRLAGALLRFPLVGVFKPRPSDEHPMLGLPVPQSFDAYLEPATCNMVLMNSNAGMLGYTSTRKYITDAFGDRQDAVLIGAVPYPSVNGTVGVRVDQWPGYLSPLARFGYYASLLALLDALSVQNVYGNSHTVLISAQGMADANADRLRELLGSISPSVFVEGRRNAKNGLMENLSTLALNVPWLLSNIETARQAVMANALNLIGIQHTNFEKKERMITDEVSNDSESNTAYRQGTDALLEDAFEQVKKVFGEDWRLKEAENADTASNPGGAKDGTQVRPDGAGSPEDPAAGK